MACSPRDLQPAQRARVCSSHDSPAGEDHNDGGGGHGDIDDGREVGSVDNAMTELDAALHCAVEHVDMLQRMEEENADVFTLDDELI